MNSKKIGNYSIDQLTKLAELIKSLPSITEEFHSELGSDPGKLFSVLRPPFYWSQIYTFSLDEHVDKIRRSSQGIKLLDGNPLPDQTVSERVDEILSGLDDPDLSLQINSESEQQIFITAWYGLILSLRSIWVYGKPLNMLVASVAAGNDNDLFKAVRIDRSILSCSPIADRLAKAQLLNETDFFKKLQNSLKGPPKKPKDEYGPLRYFLMLLHEDGTLGKLKEDERYEFFCRKLKLYPDEGKDPGGSLNSYISRWRQAQGT